MMTREDIDKSREIIDKAFFELLSDTYDWWTNKNNGDSVGAYLQGIFDMRNFLVDMVSKNDGER